MGLPPFNEDGRLPEGRHVCDLDEFESVFVLDSEMLASSTRQGIFADLLTAIGILQAMHKELIERLWVGGGYASARLDPSDVDATFLLNQVAHDSLSNSQRKKIAGLLKWGGFKRLDLKVDGFLLVRKRFAMPWEGAGVTSESTPYVSVRGAWDDWWVRERLHGAKGQTPLIQDSDPVRGYVEVIISGTNSPIEEP